ncbi:Glu-tRNA(Gln) amidotransferase subunit GatE [Candidatus Woesearchaeota archaeon]|nr:Glu-tRNA(Gln) amidotransferase subunit GatE [Candidatus Woesearchaeota archaeon]MCF7900834.1 Glu-tRNA(Gln) amidotransferase subunit GatE [Candidatus Woesearchaeota archaeon]MCF8014067.1 Glu-tRNA(Gln) amidotransferase subunit GatE [Candidatus Woesearchaeota archaeon]
MTNYKELGFKAGLEIHQQLEGKKLFCNCPTEIRKDKADFTITRRLRASAGESGKVDKAAAYELEKSKEFEYYGYHDSTCLIEIDEEPPLPVNKEALKVTLQMCQLLNMKVVDKIQFMRKTVIDGSNVSGFQRTALIGYDGYIDINGKKIGVESICLEEEAAQVVKRTKEKDTYNLSRLGIPLLEIATAPDFENPEQTKEGAAKIGMLLRSVQGMKRGIGSIRQDVNVSIKGGARTEIKGFQEIKSIPVVIDKEIERQLKIIKKGEKVEKAVRKAEPDGTTTYLRPMPGADRMYPETDVPTITPKIEEMKEIETIDQKTARYKKEYELNDDLASIAVKHENKNNYDFEELFKKHISKHLPAKTIIDLILIKPKEIEKKIGKTINIEEHKDQILGEISKAKITASAIPEILMKIAEKGKLEIEKFYQISEDEIEKIILKIIKENKDAPRGLLMGKAMAALKGKADGKLVSQILGKHLK